MRKRVEKKAEVISSGEIIPAPWPIDIALDDAIGVKARRLSKLTSALFAELSGQAEVTAMQMGVLVAIAQAGCISASDLGRRLWVDRSTLQEVLMRLLKKGIIARRKSELDKRVHEVWLTEAGLAMVQRLLEPARLVQQRIMEGLTEQQKASMLKSMTTILGRYID